MKASEFITEALTSPYKVNFHNSVTWPATEGGRDRVGVDAEFRTDAGINYSIIGYRIGQTKPERDKRKADAEAKRKRAEAGERVLMIPANPRYGGIWEIHFSQESEDRNYEKSKSGLTGTGDEFRIFATVFHVIERIASVYKPKIISIKAAHESTRVKLYERMAKKYASKIGYTYVKTTMQSDGARIELRRNESK